MGYCFIPKCNHTNLSHNSKFYICPSDPVIKKRWIRLFIRRNDRDPGIDSRVCSCHFRDGKKEDDPEIFDWNRNKSFPV